jgi:hypothetical protein
MATLQAIVGPTTYNLYGRNPYAWISLSGCGLPPVRRLKERGPQQHGSSDVGFLLDERMLNLALMVLGVDEADCASNRRALAHILKPLQATPVQLRVTGDDGLVRQIDSNVIGMVDFPNTLQERIGASQVVVVQFEAADPIPYDPALHNIVFTVAGGTGPPGGFLVPLRIPLLYTTGGLLDAVQSLSYTGDWETFPTLYLTGPMTSPVIRNVTTNKVLDFTGATITGGDTWKVDLRYGQKRITDSGGALKNAALSDASDLVTWSLVADPEAAGGVNDIRVYVPSGATVNTKVRIEYYDKYPSLD